MALEFTVQQILLRATQGVFGWPVSYGTVRMGQSPGQSGCLVLRSLKYFGQPFMPRI